MKITNGWRSAFVEVLTKVMPSFETRRPLACAGLLITMSLSAYGATTIKSKPVAVVVKSTPAPTGGCGTGIPTVACVAARNLPKVTTTYTASTNEVISDKHFSTTSGPCIRVPNGVTNVIIRDNEIGPCGTSTPNEEQSVGVYVTGTGNGSGNQQVTITRNYLHEASTLIRVIDTTNGTQITKNLMTGGKGVGWSSSYFQMFRVSGGTRQTLIQCNIADDTIIRPTRVEDHFNFGNSFGISNALPIEFAYNRIQGHPSGPTDYLHGNESGSGMQSGDSIEGGGSPRYYFVHHNIINKVNGSGLGFAGGVWDYRMEDNRVDNRGACANTSTWPSPNCSNTGWHFMMKDIYGNSCSNITIKRNRGIAALWAYNHDGTLVGDPTGGLGACASGVTFGAGADANNWQDATLNGDAMFAEAQPAICQ